MFTTRSGEIIVRVGLESLFRNVGQLLRVQRAVQHLLLLPHNNARQRHADGTCTWFLIGKEFSEWKEGARSLLWVYGIRE